MRTFEDVAHELKMCIGHAYRDEVEDIQTFGSNIEHLDKAQHLLNELTEIHNEKITHSPDIFAFKVRVLTTAITDLCEDIKDYADAMTENNEEEKIKQVSEKECIEKIRAESEEQE